jgi:hypothetical protein
MRAGIEVNVTPEDRRRLEAIVADRSAPQKYVWRAKPLPPGLVALNRAHYSMLLLSSVAYQGG